MTLQEFQALCLAMPQATAPAWGNTGHLYQWFLGRKKCFAAFMTSGEQQGPHLRSNESDMRTKPSSLAGRRIEKKHNFVWLDPKAQWSAEELQARLAKSHALAMRKDGGVSRGGEFHDLYLALRKALKATPPELRPPGPHHAGGPAAKILKREAQFARRLAVWAATELAAAVPAEDKALHAKLIKIMRAKGSSHQQLWSGHYERAGSPAVEAVKLANKSLAGSLSAPAYAADTVMILHDHLLKTDPSRLTDFIANLDDDVLKGEFIAVAAALTGKNVTCERVLWRGSDARGNAGCWVARLAPGRFALIQKVGKRWEWLEGGRDDVLAGVPDVDFKQATSIALLRDAPGQFGRLTGYS